MNRPMILDCTLRDGGYYNNWDFHPSVVQTYLDEIASNPMIDWIELGLRVPFHSSKTLGDFAYTTESTLSMYSLPNANYAVLINAKDYSCLAKADTINLLDSIFCFASDSKIKMVRVAFAANDADLGFFLIRALKRKGYEVCANIMQASPSETNLKKLYFEACLSGCYAFYFADSFGNLEAIEVCSMVRTLVGEQQAYLNSFWMEYPPSLIGFHAHDNIGNAYNNATEAIDQGADLIDATILGMGRGAGNLDLERIVGRERKQGLVYPRTEDAFHLLKEEYKWGFNDIYAKAAYNGIHPMYPQYFLATATEGHFGFLNKLIGLNRAARASFSETLAKSIIEGQL